MKFFCAKEFFPWILISKMSVKMNFRIITKNQATDLKIGSTLKIDFITVGTHESHPTAWELSKEFEKLLFWREKFVCPDFFKYFLIFVEDVGNLVGNNFVSFGQILFLANGYSFWQHFRKGDSLISDINIRLLVLSS